MASFIFDNPAVSASTTFIFGSRVCIANGSGSFNSHLANPMSAETSKQDQPDGTISDEFLLPELADEIEKLSLSYTLSTHLAPLGIDPIYFEFLRPQLPLGLHNATASYVTIMRREINQKIIDQEVTACWEAPVFDSYPNSNDEFDLELTDYSSLTIIATPLSHFMY